MTNLLDDLCVLTTIAPTNFGKLVKLSEAVLCHSLAESLRDKKEFAEVDIGIGMLYIKNTEDGLKYKFIPSEHLSATMDTTARTKNSPLGLKVDEVLGKRIMNTYKDLF
jgi:hypothetical protein